MLRAWVALIGILVLAGCKGSGSAGAPTDPFFGRTRVEPPRTGALRGQLPSTNNVSQATTGTATSPGGTLTQPGTSPGQATSPSSGSLSPSSIQPSQTTGPSSGWSPAQPRVNPVPAAIPPQTSGQYLPPDGSFGYPGSSGTASPSGVSTSGDRLSIPVAARSLGGSGADWSTRHDTSSPPMVQSAGSGQAGLAAAGSAGIPSAATSNAIGGVPNATPYLSSAPASGLAGRERISREIEPSSGGLGSGPRYSPEPRTAAEGSPIGSSLPPASGRPVNIADLPEARP